MIAETYMAMLEKIKFDKERHLKYPECVICIREFEEGEDLMQIPNCEHIFHE